MFSVPIRGNKSCYTSALIDTTSQLWNFNWHISQLSQYYIGRFEPILHWNIEIQWARWANTTLQNWNFNGHAVRFQPILHWNTEISMGTLVDLSQHCIGTLKFQWARWSIWANTTLQNWNFNGHAVRFQPILHWKISMGTLVDLSQHYIANLKFQWARWSISANTALEHWNFNGLVGRFEPILHWNIEISMGTLGQHYIAKLKFQWARWSISANTTLEYWNFKGHVGRFEPILHWNIEISMGTLVDLSQYCIGTLKFQWALVDFSQYYIEKFQWARWSILANTTLQNWNFNGHVGRVEPILHWNIEILMGSLVDLSQYCIGTLKFQWVRWSISANTTLEYFNGHAGRF